MAVAVEVPKLGNTVEECIVSKWRKQVGETVAAGEVVADIETDKATFEVPAPSAGTLLARFFDEGALAPVFANLFVIGEAGEDVEAFRPKAEADTAVTEAAAAASVVEAVPSPATVGNGSGSMSPRARRFADEHDFHPATIAGSGPGGRVLEEDIRNLYFSTPRVSGAARRQAAAEGLRAPLEGSGAGGMVLASDLGAAVERMPAIRERIARRMRESLASTAQYTLHSSAWAGGLLSLRARIKASKGVADITINDLVVFCTIKALLDAPEMNAWLIDGNIQKHSQVHIGFACDTPRGLMVPVIRDAHALTAGELARRGKDLAARAVSGGISPDDLSGATFTVSNLGGLGIESFTPLLNPPQVGILGVGAIELKPVRREGRVEFADMIALSLTCDHQVIDGAPGARFLKVVREKIENVESLCTIW